MNIRYPVVFWDIDGTIFRDGDPPGGFGDAPSKDAMARAAHQRAEQVLRLFSHQPPADLPRVIAGLDEELRARHGMRYSIETLAGALYERLGLAGRREEHLLLADAFWGPRYRGWLYPGCAEALTTLHRAGVRMGVITNNTATGRMMRGALAAVGLADCFGPVVCSCDIGAKKPDPRIFNAALAALAPPPGNSGAVLYVGDSPANDLAGALASGWDAALHLGEGGAAADTDRAVLAFTDYRQVVSLVLGEEENP